MHLTFVFYDWPYWAEKLSDFEEFLGTTYMGTPYGQPDRIPDHAWTHDYNAIISGEIMNPMWDE